MLEEKLNEAFGGDWTYMPGTEGTGEYVVVAATDMGRVGYRELEGGYRIRVEPLNDRELQLLSGRSGWKQLGEDDQPRYSTIVGSAEDSSEEEEGSEKPEASIEELKPTLVLAMKAIGAGEHETLISPNIPDIVRNIANNIQFELV